MPTPSPPPSTALRLEGRDVLDLLHRISTQSLADLAPGTARATLFCDFRGRLLHRAIVARTGDDAVWLVRHDAPPEPLASYLDRNVFRDDVRIDDRSSEWPVHGTGGDLGLALGTIAEHVGVPTAIRLDASFGLTLGGPDGPSESGLGRVRAGRAAHGHEIVDEFNPYEVGLGADVHLDKGCYTGQEILLRLVTYRGVRRTLVQVAGDGAPPETPADLQLEERVVGRLTTALADGDRWLGLSVVRSDAIADGTRLATASGRPLASLTPFPAKSPLGRP